MKKIYCYQDGGTIYAYHDPRWAYEFFQYRSGIVVKDHDLEGAARVRKQFFTLYQEQYDIQF